VGSSPYNLLIRQPAEPNRRGLKGESNKMGLIEIPVHQDVRICGGKEGGPAFVPVC
jgi:hypothetical protein